MKKLVVSLLAALGVQLLPAAVIEQVLVRQQWPWSTDVKIEYRISGLDGSTPVDIVVTASDGAVPLDSSRLAASLSGDVYGIVANGVGTILLDPIRAFGTEKAAMADFNVELAVKASAANVDEVLYKVVDLNTGSVSDIRRRDFLNGRCGAYETDYGRFGTGFATSLSDELVWTDVTNRTEFMVEKMVFRKVSAKGVVWQMGETEAAAGSKPVPFWATLDADYYLSVFPVTQGQYDKYRPEDKYGAFGTDADDHLLCPVADMFVGDVLGAAKYTFLSRMKAKCGLDVTLPTEAQWEFACRGGNYATALYSGKPFAQGAIFDLSWSQDNADGTLHRVGQKRPNAYGLYEMLGNAAEYCLNFYFDYPSDSSQTTPVVNPGADRPASGAAGTYVFRGGYYTLSRTCCRAAYRESINLSSGYKRSGKPVGFRVCFPAE